MWRRMAATVGAVVVLTACVPPLPLRPRLPPVYRKVVVAVICDDGIGNRRYQFTATETGHWMYQWLWAGDTWINGPWVWPYKRGDRVPIESGYPFRVLYLPPGGTKWVILSGVIDIPTTRLCQ
jgi:hypothetical protein